LSYRVLVLCMLVVTLKGSVKFNANEGSTLVASAAGITMDDNCNVKFTKSTGQNGTAVSLLGSISETTLL